MEKEYPSKKYNHIIFFDGECILCNRFIQFVLQNDVFNTITFVSLQSDFAESFLTERQVIRDFTTIYFFDNGKIFDKSSAVLRIMLKLGFPYNLMYGLIILPKFIRDTAYKFISQKRHSFFSNATVCHLPSQEELKRIIR